MTYFEALQYPAPRLRLDLDDLQKRFYARSRELHPDRFARAPQAEQQAALDASSVLNGAYRTLRHHVLRAEYVLKLSGFDVGEQRAPADLLEEVFDLNMALEELQGGDESARAQVDAARVKFEAMLGEIDSRLDGFYAAYDVAGDQAVLEKVRAELNRRRYVSNLIASASGERVRH